MTIRKVTNRSSTIAVTPAAVSDTANTSTGQFDLPAGTTAQRPGSSLTGSQRFNTTLGVMEYYDGTAWKKVSPQMPTLSSITGNVYAGVATTLTLAGTNFLTSSLVVNFSQSGDNINTDVTVTPSSDTAATVAVPAAVYSNVTAGNVVSIKVTNSDLAQSSGISKTALALPTGGTVSVVNGYRVHAFTSGANFVIPTGVTISADYLIVAGGGGGGGWGGGGGAGGTRLLTSQSMTAGTYAAVIGAGGSAGGYSPPYTQGGDGNVSSFNSATSAAGGGGGAFESGDYVGRNGGSGGGGSIGNQGANAAGGTGTSGQGNNGGVGGDMDAGGNYYTRGGGGGGKGAVGFSGLWNPETNAGDTATLGAGGVGGDFSSQFGTAYGESGFFGGGGGGHSDGRFRAWTSERCLGGNGGGGLGGSYVSTGGDQTLSGAVGRRGDNGDANTGGGGGGSYGASQNPDGTSGVCGSGGSGIVLVRYQLT